jgi:DMSO/TMAO reductase YedYZ molybdopterin-dependent catalytic subunit
MVIVSKWLPIRFSVLCYASGFAEAADAFGVIIGAGVRMLGRVKDAYIAAKERWARKMAGQKPHKPHSANRLPPGQRLVQDFPVLDLGVRPEMPLEKWELKIQGQVDNPVTLTWPQFLALPQFKDVSDFHCVTTWSQFDMEWEGVSLLTIAELVRPKREARHILFESYDGYSTNNPIEVCLDDDVLIAHKWNGKPLSLEHGGPARVIIPKRYAWKGAKFIHQITFLDRDVLGYWELRGYSNTADPWSEDRFADKNSIPPGFP